MASPLPGLPLTTRYAIAAAAALARHPLDELVSTRLLAEETAVPAAFLSKVMGMLREAGLVRGERGRSGGYTFARDPATIKLGEVVAAVCEDCETDVCVMGDRNCGGDDPCQLHDLWSVASSPLAKLMETVSILDVAKRG
jgi:Rrf2 family transcriptional regulator, iron-sulfur cluster assembly transcription factor